MTGANERMREKAEQVIINFMDLTPLSNEMTKRLRMRVEAALLEARDEALEDAAKDIEEINGFESRIHAMLIRSLKSKGVDK